MMRIFLLLVVFQKWSFLMMRFCGDPSYSKPSGHQALAITTIFCTSFHKRKMATITTRTRTKTNSLQACQESLKNHKHKFGTHLCNEKLNSPTFLFQGKLGSPNKNRNSFYHNMISEIQVPIMLGPKTIALLFSNHWNNVNKHKGIMRESEFQHNKYMETAHCLSSVAISTVFCFWFLLSIMSPSCETHMGTSPIDVQTLRRTMAKWIPFLELLGLMVVVCGVATMMVSGKKFSLMQNAMFLFWAISMNLVPLLKKHYCF